MEIKDFLRIGLIIGVIIMFFIVWGLIGANESDKVGTTCDVGVFEDRLCWKWHKNFIGEVEEGISDLKEGFSERD
ncbi:MAG: hypothetical protein ACOC1P_03605 [Minisyncoccales bacterium]